MEQTLKSSKWGEGRGVIEMQAEKKKKKRKKETATLTNRHVHWPYPQKSRQNEANFPLFQPRRWSLATIPPPPRLLTQTTASSPRRLPRQKTPHHQPRRRTAWLTSECLSRAVLPLELLASSYSFPSHLIPAPLLMQDLTSIYILNLFYH